MSAILKQISGLNVAFGGGGGGGGGGRRSAVSSTPVLPNQSSMPPNNEGACVQQGTTCYSIFDVNQNGSVVDEALFVGATVATGGGLLAEQITAKAAGWAAAGLSTSILGYYLGS